MIYLLRLNWIIRKIRNEYVVRGKIEFLRRVSQSAKLVAGIFPPILDSAVITEMCKSIQNTGNPNPFKNVDAENNLVIHYRLGDMRKMPARNSKFEEHGVVDPLLFKEVIEKFQAREDN